MCKSGWFNTSICTPTYTHVFTQKHRKIFHCPRHGYTKKGRGGGGGGNQDPTCTCMVDTHTCIIMGSNMLHFLMSGIAKKIPVKYMYMYTYRAFCA